MAAAETDTNSLAPARIKIRIESLSDLVFGLALSIGSLILIGRTPASGVDLAANVVLFGFGFAIVVLIWFGYSRTTAVLAMESPSAMLSNVVLLFFVALEPYLFYVLQSVQTAGLADAASVAYALDLGGMFLMLAALGRLVLREAKMPVPGRSALHPVVLGRFRRVSRADAIAGAVFVVSALPIFWIDTPAGYLRFYLWSIGFVAFIPALGRRWSQHRIVERENQSSAAKGAT